MKATVYDLMDAIGNVSDYVVMETSARSRQVRERAHIRWAVTAACICYVAVMALIGIYKSGLSAIEPPSGMFLPGKEVMGPSDTAGTVGTDTVDADTDTTEPEAPRPCDSILKVLRGEGEFRTSGGKYFDLEHISDYLGYDKAEVTIKFTPIDMDGDGTFEAVFEFLDSDGYLTDTAILYMYNGEVYVTSLPPRGLSALKTDGTFFWWDITEFNGCSRIESFTDSGEVTVDVITRTSLTPEGGYFIIESRYPVYFTADGTKITDHDLISDIILKLLHDYNWDHDDDYGPLYLVDNEKVSEAEYEKAVNEQNAKEDVEWKRLADVDLEKYYGDGSADADTSTDTDTTESREPRPCNSILKVLRGEGDFCASRGEYFDIKHLYAALSFDFADVEFDFDVANFAPMDLDGDGTYEAVFKFKRDNYYGPEGYIILYMRDGEVCSGTLVDRQGYNLKADGTFVSSSGAGAVGLYRITSFDDDGSGIKYFSFYIDYFTYEDQYQDNEDLWYVVDHEQATEEEFWEAYDQHEKQEDVEWKKLADVDLEQYFE